VKVVKIDGRKAHQYTAIDDCTRLNVLRLSRELNQHSSLDFLGEARPVPRFPILRQPCAPDAGFPLASALSIRGAGIRHRSIRPQCPEPNWKVARCHRSDAEEFWRRVTLTAFESATRGLREGKQRYNFEPLSTALGGDGRRNG